MKAETVEAVVAKYTTKVNVDFTSVKDQRHINNLQKLVEVHPHPLPPLSKIHTEIYALKNAINEVANHKQKLFFSFRLHCTKRIIPSTMP